VDAQLFQDVSRPTIVKSRYRVENKTLLRVNKVKQHQISTALQERIYRSLTELVEKIDLLVFSDFNYGVLPQTLVDRIIALCEAKGIPMVADSQTSSQVGDISRYHNMLLVTPTEKEVRSALNNNTDGLVVLAEKLREKSNAGNIAITLGADGVFIHTPKQSAHAPWQTDLIPALNKRAIDPAGGGDCFLATASLLLCAGYDVWLAYYVASIAAACQVSRVGNMPLSQQELLKYLNRHGVLA
jgi:rfaE bifunctional protein kinase chain/domain